MNKINKLIKKAIKITPEEKFKLRLKRELKEQEERRLKEKIVEGVIEELIPLDDRVISLNEKTEDLEKNTEKTEVLLKKSRISLEEVKGKLERVDKSIGEIKKDVNGKIGDIESGLKSSQTELMEVTKERIEQSANTLASLIKERNEGDIKLADSLKELKSLDNKNELNEIKSVLNGILDLAEPQDLTTPLEDIKSVLNEIKDKQSLVYIETALSELVKRKPTSTKEVVSILKDVYDVLLKAWLPSENALQVIVKNQPKISTGGGIVPFQDSNRNPVKPLVNSSGALSVVSSENLPTEGLNATLGLTHDVDGNVFLITKIISGATYTKGLTYANGNLSGVGAWVAV